MKNQQKVKISGFIFKDFLTIRKQLKFSIIIHNQIQFNMSQAVNSQNQAGTQSLLSRLSKSKDTRQQEDLKFLVEDAKLNWQGAMNNTRRSIAQAQRMLEAALDAANLTEIIQYKNQLINLQKGLEIAESYYTELFPTEVEENEENV